MWAPPAFPPLPPAIVHLATMLCIGFPSAGQVLIAQQMGRGDLKSVSTTIGNLLSALIILVILLSALCIFYAGSIKQ